MITKDELLRRKELYEKGEFPKKEVKPQRTIKEPKERPKKEPIVRAKRGSPEFRAKVGAGVKKARQEHPERWANATWKYSCKGKPSGFRKKVRCIELDIVFSSIEAANNFCRQNGASKRALGYVLSGKKETAAGYHWELVKKG